MAETSFKQALKDDLMRLYNSACQARQNMVPMICDLQLPKTRDAVVAELAAIHNHLSGCASVAVNDGFFCEFMSHDKFFHNYRIFLLAFVSSCLMINSSIIKESFCWPFNV